jgi:hypothetical protein
MPTSEARIRANQQNAAKSTGPKTVEGKEKSRRNSLKHGLTGSGTVLPETDLAEVERRRVAFSEEMMVIGEIGQALVRRAALNSVRMERAADQQTVALTQRIRQVEADFEAPEGVDEAKAAQLRAEAVRVAMFDPSKEATLARRYEAAAERGFFKAINELRRMERQAEALLKADEKASIDAMMASFLAKAKADGDREEAMAARYPELALPIPRTSANFAQFPATTGLIDVPMTIGRAR